MRTRLFLALLMVAFSAIIAMLVFIRVDSPRQISEFMMGGEVTDIDKLTSDLEDYFEDEGSWEGVDSILNIEGMQGRGLRGGMGQRYILANSDGFVITDTNVNSEERTLTDEELSASMLLTDDSGNGIGRLLIQGGFSLNSGLQEQLLSRIRQAAWRAGLLAAAIALLLAFLMSWQILRPVATLTNAVDSIARGGLNQRVPVEGDDELALLAHSFNHMADSLALSESRRKAMTADIAHELRTPLTVERAQLEAMQDGVSPLDSRSLEVLLKQNQLLGRLVDDLRVLALADAGELRLEYEVVNMSALLSAIKEKFNAIALGRGIEITFETNAEANLPLETDSNRVEQIVGNLLSNALRFAPDDSLISITLSQLGGKALIKVRDSGLGIPSESLPHLFERFYRSDNGRARDNGGTGLGLAIARQLARVLGGDLIAGNHPMGGAEFTFILPLNSK